jgi:hypothetical protein
MNRGLVAAEAGEPASGEEPPWGEVVWITPLETGVDRLVKRTIR